MKKSLVLLTLLVVIVAAVALVACNPNDGENLDPNAVTIMGKETDLNKPYMTEIFEHYTTVTGKKLNIIKVEDNKFEDAAVARMADPAKAPDILLHFNNADLSRFNVAENFEYLTDAEWVSDLTDSAATYCRDAAGNILGLPFWESSVSGCYYNKKLFDEYGLVAATNQNEFRNLLNQLKEVVDVPLLWPAEDCTWMPQFALDPIFADDPTLLDKLNANQIKYADIPAVKRMINWIHTADNSNWFGNAALNTGWDDMAGQLASGKAAMVFIWDTWFYTDFSGVTYTKDDFALMPIFMNTLSDGSGTYEGGNLNMMMVNKNSTKKKDALAFLNFCAQPENYNVAFKGIATVSVFKQEVSNVQSHMVTDMQASINALERPSTASIKIIGYSADDVMAAINKLLRGECSIDECIAQMDSARIARAKALGAAGF